VLACARPWHAVTVRLVYVSRESRRRSLTACLQLRPPWYPVAVSLFVFPLLLLWLQGEVAEAEGDTSDAERKAAAKMGTGSSVAAWVQQLGQATTQWRDQYLPKEVREMDRSTGNVDSGIFRFFERECRIGAELLQTVRGDIGAIEDVCSETIKPTNRLRSVMKSLHEGRIPGLEWDGRFTTPSVMLAASWVQDLGKRLQQLIALTDNKACSLSQTDWARRGVWLGGLFTPKAFFTATRQETAAQLQCSVQELRLVVELGGESEQSLRAKPFGSFLVEGLALEGAHWDSKARTLVVPAHDDQSVSTPIDKTSFRWVPASKVEGRADAHNLLVPLYANNERADVLVTVNLPVPKDKPLEFWHPRAVALISWAA
jgi:dynein heavy chain 1